MTSLLLTIAIATLAVPSFAAISKKSGPSCPMRGARGPYTYDPMTGKGPADWGDLKPSYEMWKIGASQSPIDIPLPSDYKPRAEGPIPSLSLSNFTIVPGSSNWALTCHENSTCGSTNIHGKTFHVVNIHLHSPSEHLLLGKQFPLEAHIVHSSHDGQLAVLVTMFDFVNDTTYAAMAYNGIPKELGHNGMLGHIFKAIHRGEENIILNPGRVVSAREGFCSYRGSLTTPPCSEGVTFFMSMHVRTVTKRQVSRFRLSAGAGYDGNNRPVMPLNGRNVTCYV